MARGCELEDRSAPAPQGTALARRAVQVPGPVEVDVANRATAVRATLEAVEHHFVPRSVPQAQLIHSTQVVRAVVVRGAEQGARTIEGQPAVGEARVGLSLEGVQGG